MAHKVVFIRHIVLIEFELVSDARLSFCERATASILPE